MTEVGRHVVSKREHVAGPQASLTQCRVAAVVCGVRSRSDSEPSVYCPVLDKRNIYKLFCKFV